MLIIQFVQLIGDLLPELKILFQALEQRCRSDGPEYLPNGGQLVDEDIHRSANEVERLTDEACPVGQFIKKARDRTSHTVEHRPSRYPKSLQCRGPRIYVLYDAKQSGPNRANGNANRPKRGGKLPHNRQAFGKLCDIISQHLERARCRSTEAFDLRPYLLNNPAQSAHLFHSRPKSIPCPKRKLPNGITSPANNARALLRLYTHLRTCLCRLRRLRCR